MCSKSWNKTWETLGFRNCCRWRMSVEKILLQEWKKGGETRCVTLHKEVLSGRLSSVSLLRSGRDGWIRELTRSVKVWSAEEQHLEMIWVTTSCFRPTISPKLSLHLKFYSEIFHFQAHQKWPLLKLGSFSEEFSWPVYDRVIFLWHLFNLKQLTALIVGVNITVHLLVWRMTWPLSTPSSVSRNPPKARAEV